MLSTPSVTPESTGPNKITRGHSCVLCQQRKVKCDRQKPCANCLKARVECVASVPTLPRRRRRKLAETDLIGRLRRYEQLLKSHGVKVEDDEPAEADLKRMVEPLEYEDDGTKILSMTTPRPRDAERGALFANQENSHYVENTLWENLRDEIADPRDTLPGSSSDDEINEPGGLPIPEALLMSHGQTSKNLSSFHPTPVHIFRLWQTFLGNVNPLVKMFHAPTFQQILLDASGDLENIPRHTEALMFSMYFLSITSMQNDECQTMFGEPRSVLLAKYSYATQQALINARFLKSLNIGTLQALVLYLLGVRTTYDPHTMWVLTGATVRVAQRLGLHRDGSNHKISPFDAEIRRRTWWQIVFLDGYSSKLAGAGFPGWLSKFDTKVPLNISDSDLSPAMKDPPTEKEGVTEMVFCSLRYETAQALRRAATVHGASSSDENWAVPTGTHLIEHKDKAINELEARFEQKYLRFCDPSIPLHLLAIYVAKSVICTMRIMAHHPRQYPDKGASMPQSEKDMLFTESLKEMEYDSMGHTTKCIQGYLWHVSSHFQLDAFIYLLSELRFRTKGELADRAWKQVTLSFTQRPEIIKDSKNSLYVAIGNLTLKAWAKREEAVGLHQISTPQFVSLLRAQRNIPEPPRSEIRNEDLFSRRNQTVTYSGSEPSQDALTYGNLNDSGAGTNYSMDMNMADITAVNWEYWQTLMDGDLPAYNGAEDYSSQWWT